MFVHEILMMFSTSKIAKCLAYILDIMVWLPNHELSLDMHVSLGIGEGSENMLLANEWGVFFLVFGIEGS
jgi:hypothetical protein